MRSDCLAQMKGCPPANREPTTRILRFPEPGVYVQHLLQKKVAGPPSSQPSAIVRTMLRPNRGSRLHGMFGKSLHRKLKAAPAQHALGNMSEPDASPPTARVINKELQDEEAAGMFSSPDGQPSIGQADQMWHELRNSTIKMNTLVKGLYSELRESNQKLEADMISMRADLARLAHIVRTQQREGQPKDEATDAGPPSPPSTPGEVLTLHSNDTDVDVLKRIKEEQRQEIKTLKEQLEILRGSLQQKDGDAA
ncbi:hypothetical protein CYMTET_53435 [Cymbomonas tetramitiformis]|uniref:Uncharacterized protein n=1 Tax=Cymbomonas tetramitiformis TaxID=36881 RepID=A0AAE0BIR9_9CHLO|nr:hypothetical protein CYMTET_53435 [Cymbomonas tetramitiformis]